MSSSLPNCPRCGSEYTYQDRRMYVCPECANEWSMDASADDNDDRLTVSDINGNPLKDGDTITVTKDLKIKGSSSVIKIGTRVKNIRLIDGDHEIECKIAGLGGMKLKSGSVKKV